MADNIATAYVRILPEMTGIKNELEAGLSKTSGGAGGMAGKAFGSAFSVAAKVGIAGVSAAATAVAGLTTAAVSNYSEYEQLVGGIETLYKGSADTMMNYANQAFATAGMSVNDYMETAIQSSAAMISSLEGDTAKAADMTNLSMIDMADNVNKMGTTMEAVQNAYRGFSRGNFTMLDNLALGFAGTKEGMKELLEAAQKISGVEYDISSYSDIVQAIHVVQEEMGIAGTTSKEAADTIQGSTGSMKAAWENLVTGIANPNADLGKLIDNFITSAKAALKNIIPVFKQGLTGVAQLVKEIAPIIAQELPGLIEEVLPPLIEAAASLIAALIENLPRLLTVLANALPQALETVWNALKESWPAIQEALMEFLDTTAGKVIAVIGGVMLTIKGMGIVKSITGVFDAIKSIGTITSNVAPTVIENMSSMATNTATFGTNAAAAATGGSKLMGILKTVGTLALGAADALLVMYDVQTLADAAEGYNDAAEAHANELDQAFANYQKLYEEKGKETADEWAKMVYQIDTTSMSMAEAQQAIAQKIEGYWDGVPQSMWEGFKAGWDHYFGENGAGLMTLMGDAFHGAVDGVKNILGVHSPSTVFEEIGANSSEGYAIGFEKGLGKVDKAIAGLSTDVVISASAQSVQPQPAANVDIQAVVQLLAQYLPAILAKQLIVDENSLNRGLAPGMDKELGMRAYYQNREVMA